MSITNRLVQACALIAASISAGRSTLPPSAHAQNHCFSCVAIDECKKVYGGATSCYVGGDSQCHQSAEVCQGS